VRISFFSSFPPKNCGVGQFCSDLIDGIKYNAPETVTDVYAVDNIPAGYQYPSIVKDHFYFQDKIQYSKIADEINKSASNLCVIQHEPGLFGGNNKEYIFEFIDKLTIPFVTVLHTIPVDETSETYLERKNHILNLNLKSKHFITMSQAGKQGLIKLGINPEKITVIIHGAPLMPPLSEKNKIRKELNLPDEFIITDFGLLNDKKGIEYLIDSIKLLVNKGVRKIKCLIIGVPLSPKHIGYIKKIKYLATENKLHNYVLFIDKYLNQPELFRYIIASDVIVTPYLSTNQTSSGVLTFTVAAGVPVISTPYPYAQELLKNIGVLVPYKDSTAISQEITKLIYNQTYYQSRQEKTLLLGKSLSWTIKAKEYLDLFNQTIINT